MDRRIMFVFAVVAMVALLAGCSIVFEAGISGKVVTESGTSKVAVGNVDVFVYTDKGQRDSDFAKFTAGKITRPSSGSGYVATTNTNANGEFVVNKIVWETKNSEFGKTADVNSLYLIFYHEDYKPAKKDATVISGSTNGSNVYVVLEGSKDYTTVNVTVYDVATGFPMDVPCTLEYLVEGAAESDTVVLTGSTTVGISYEKDRNVDVTFKLTAPGENWKMVDKDGQPIAEHVELDVSEGTLNVRLYMKSFEVTLPGFSGTVLLGGEQITLYSTPSNENDNVKVWLQYKKVGTADEWVSFAETELADHRTYSTQIEVGNSLYYSHGQFNGVGNSGNYSIVVDEESYPDAVDWANYTGKTISMDLRLVFGATDKVKEFTYTNLSDSNLGLIDLN